MRAQRRVTWTELTLQVSHLRQKLMPHVGEQVLLYGIPTGGSVIATMLAESFRQRGRAAVLLESPTPGCLVVDDICDSGDTLRPYLTDGYKAAVIHCRPNAQRKPTWAVETTEDWIVYPYEKQEDPGREVVTRMIQLIGDDPKREGLEETPSRVIKAWQEVFVGYRGEEPKLTTFESKDDAMVTLRNIDFVSFCEHHLLPFWGKAAVGYIPNGRVLGLSKLARVVEYRSRRLQLQERLAAEIADMLCDAMPPEHRPKGVGVLLEATHMCMVARGIKKDECVMATSVLRGALREDEAARAEFLELVRRA